MQLVFRSDLSDASMVPFAIVLLLIANRSPATEVVQQQMVRDQVIYSIWESQQPEASSDFPESEDGASPTVTPL